MNTGKLTTKKIGEMKNQNKKTIALVGTETFLGKEMKNILERKNLPFNKIEFFDPGVEEEYSKLTEFKGEARVIQNLEENSLLTSDLVFLASEKKVNHKYGLEAYKHKYKAIDLKQTFNHDQSVPLVVAGVNHQIIFTENPSLVANPHPVSIILSHVFHLFKNNFGVLKALAFILQPVSVFEESGIEELANQSVSTLGSTSISKKVFPAQIAFNLLSHTETLDEKGFSPGEKQIMEEIKRVLGEKDFPISLSLVQAPVFHSYSIMSYIELKKEVGIKSLQNVFERSPYFHFLPPTPSRHASCVSVAGKEELYVGQIKEEEKFPSSFWMWIVADNITRGSTLNALEIAQNFISSSH